MRSSLPVFSVASGGGTSASYRKLRRTDGTSLSAEGSPPPPGIGPLSFDTLTAQFPTVVESVMPVQKRYKLVSREAHKSNSVIRVGKDIVLGGKEFVVMAGPCSVESEAQLLAFAAPASAAASSTRRLSAVSRFMYADRARSSRERSAPPNRSSSTPG